MRCLRRPGFAPGAGSGFFRSRKLTLDPRRSSIFGSCTSWRDCWCWLFCFRRGSRRPATPPAYLGMHFILSPPEPEAVVSRILQTVELVTLAIGGMYLAWLFREKP